MGCCVATWNFPLCQGVHINKCEQKVPPSRPVMRARQTRGPDGCLRRIAGAYRVVRGRVRSPKSVPCFQLGAWGAPTNRCWLPLLGGAASLLEYVEIGCVPLSGHAQRATDGGKHERLENPSSSRHRAGIAGPLQKAGTRSESVVQFRFAHRVAGRALRGSRTTLKYALNSLGVVSVVSAVSLSLSQEWRTTLAALLAGDEAPAVLVGAAAPALLWQASQCRRARPTWQPPGSAKAGLACRPYRAR